MKLDSEGTGAHSDNMISEMHGALQLNKELHIKQK